MEDYHWDENYLTTGELIATNWPKAMEIVGLAKEELIELDSMLMVVVGPIENFVEHFLRLMGYEMAQLHHNARRHVTQFEEKIRHAIWAIHHMKKHHHGHHHEQKQENHGLYDQWLNNDWGMLKSDELVQSWNIEFLDDSLYL